MSKPVRVWSSIALAGLLLLTGCSTLERSIEHHEPTVPSRLAATQSPLTLTASTSSVTASYEPTATVTPYPSPGASGTPTPPPTTPPAPSATPLSTQPAVPPSAPQVLAFSAERVETAQGEALALTWEAVGEQVSFCPLIGERTVGCRCRFGVPLTGTHIVAPSEIIGRYSGFQLTVEAGGIRTVRYIPVTVACPDHRPHWFLDDPPPICPRDEPLHSYAAVQRFEHGFMIWLAAQDTYYILYDRFLTPAGGRSISATLKSLQILHDPLDLKPGASPDNRVAERPPDGRFEPVSGFGLVWRGEVASVSDSADIRPRLGWAVAPEYGFDTVYQCEMSCDSYWDCYLRGPAGEILHLYWLLHFGYFWEVIE